MAFEESIGSACCDDDAIVLATGKQFMLFAGEWLCWSCCCLWRNVIVIIIRRILFKGFCAGGGGSPPNHKEWRNELKCMNVVPFVVVRGSVSYQFGKDALLSVEEVKWR